MYPKEQLQEVEDLITIVRAHLEAVERYNTPLDMVEDILMLEKAEDLLKHIGTEDKKV